MKIKTIEILGKSWRVGFDFSVMIQYEEDFGRVFELDKISSNGAQICLIYAVLRAFNDEFTMSVKDFSHSLTPDDMLIANSAIADSLYDFYNIPKIAEAHVEAAEEGDPTPNA